MKKILIGISVPSIQESFDLLVPVNMQIRELSGLIAKGLEQVTDGHFMRSGRELLCLKEPERLLSLTATLENYGITDGDKLILF